MNNRRPASLIAWITMLVLLALTGTGRAQEIPAGDSLAVADSLVVDSLAIDELVPLASRFRARGPMIHDLLVRNGRLWLCGDSCLVGELVNDSTLTILPARDGLPLNTLVSHGGNLLAGGVKGRVFRVQADSLVRLQLDDERDILDLASDGGTAMLCGEEGLLARLSTGRIWDLLEAPLPMRFYSLEYSMGSWWLGGAGGRLFQSGDRGGNWQLAWRHEDRKAILRIRPAPDGNGLLLLLRGGELVEYRPGTGAMVLREGAGEDYLGLLAAPDGSGIYLSGHDGSILSLSDEEWVELPVAGAAGFPALVWQRGLVAGGSWRSLIRFQPGTEDWRSLGLGSGPDLEDMASGQTEEVAQVPGGLPPDDYSGPRFFQNVLETDARCTTTPTRRNQLVRSYHPLPRQGVAGRVMLALDVSARGELESTRILSEQPAGVGFGEAAQSVAGNLSFTPGFGPGGMVSSRILYPVYFEASDHAAGGGWQDPAAEMDSLLSSRPGPVSTLDAQRLYKQMSFPGKARRHVWDGEVLIEYLIAPGGELFRPLVLEEPEKRLGFAAHAIDRLERFALEIPDSLELLPGQVLRVVQRIHFDRRAKKDVKKGKIGTGDLLNTLLSVQVDTASRYDPGLDQLEWLLNDFLDSAVVADWPRQSLNLVLRQDGRLQSLDAQVLEGELPDLDPDLLFSLAYYFTWGRPRDFAEKDALDTLIIEWKPRAFDAVPANRPASLNLLLEGVKY